MKKYSFLAISIAILLVLCLPISSFAAGELTPKRVNIYGVIYGTSGSPTYYAASTYQVNSTDFTFVSSQTLTSVANLRIYFEVPEGVQTFDITLTLLDDRLLVPADGTFNNLIYLYDGYPASSGQTDISSQTTRVKSTDTEGRAVYHYQFISSTNTGKKLIMLAMPLAATVIGAGSYINVRVNDFYLNGSSIEQIEISEYNEGIADTISELSANEDEWWQLVVLPGYEDYLNNTEINAATSDYKLVIKEVTFNNFLVPSLIILVFTFAFYGFVFFGKKG